MIANVKSNNLDKAMTQEQFSQVVGAILEGKYSWACVLILRFAGYNPLHYIPYRTYNRLMKDNEALARQSGSCRDDYAKPAKPKVVDLEYLDRCKQTTDLRGGYIPYVEELRYEPVFPLNF